MPRIVQGGAQYPGSCTHSFPDAPDGVVVLGRPWEHEVIWTGRYARQMPRQGTFQGGGDRKI